MSEIHLQQSDFIFFVFVLPFCKREQVEINTKKKTLMCDSDYKHKLIAIGDDIIVLAQL